MKNVCTFYGNLEYVRTIWYIIRPFGIIRGDLINFPVLVPMLRVEKSGSPGPNVIGMTCETTKVEFVCRIVTKPCP
jgi:hypothetical protein